MRIGGLMPWFFLGKEPDFGWGVLVEKDKEFSVYVLHLCATALPVDGTGTMPLQGPAHLFTRDPKTGAIQPYALPSLEPAMARAHLHDLLGDFLSAPDFDDLSAMQIEKIRQQAGKSGRAIRDWEEELESRREEEEENPFARNAFSARVLRALRTEVPGDAGAKIARRLEPYLEWKPT
jgi:hypothetical protein